MFCYPWENLEILEKPHKVVNKNNLIKQAGEHERQNHTHTESLRPQIIYIIHVMVVR